MLGLVQRDDDKEETVKKRLQVYGARQASCRLIFSAAHCMKRLVRPSKSKSRLTSVATRARGGQLG